MRLIATAMLVAVLAGCGAAGRTPTPAPTPPQVLSAKAGQILFGTTPGADFCTVGHPTDQITSTDPLFFASRLTERMDGQQIVRLHVTRDGADVINFDEPADGASFVCYGNPSSLGPLTAGQYVFEVLHKGTVEATGTLRVDGPTAT